MRIYVAGSWQSRTEVKNLMLHLEKTGHTITRDWTTHEDPALGHKYCVEDIHGIDECDVFIMFLSDKKSFGKAFEMGYAYANNKHIIAFGNSEFATSVFFELHGTVSLDNHEVARIMFVDTIEYLTAYLYEHRHIN